MVVACNNSSESDRGRASLLQMAKSASRAAPAQDPCTLVSALEIEPFVGELATPPYRASDGTNAPDVAGEECLYCGKDGRQVTVLADWQGGGTMGKVLEHIPNNANAATTGTDARGTDSMPGNVPQHEDAGPWSKATWIPAGSLFVYEGDAQIRIDVSGAHGQKSNAIALAREIAPRVGHPLSYDGSTAAARAKAMPRAVCARATGSAG
jgi:hypothetical protein